MNIKVEILNINITISVSHIYVFIWESYNLLNIFLVLLHSLFFYCLLLLFALFIWLFFFLVYFLLLNIFSISVVPLLAIFYDITIYIKSFFEELCDLLSWIFLSYLISLESKSFEYIGENFMNFVIASVWIENINCFLSCLALTWRIFIIWDLYISELVFDDIKFIGIIDYLNKTTFRLSLKSQS